MYQEILDTAVPAYIIGNSHTCKKRGRGIIISEKIIRRIRKEKGLTDTTGFAFLQEKYIYRQSLTILID